MRQPNSNAHAVVNVLSCAALALGVFLFLKGLVALSLLLSVGGVAVLGLSLRGVRGLVEDTGSIMLFADRVEVRGLLSGELDFPIEGLDAYLETRTGVVAVGMGAPVTVATARSLVLRTETLSTKIPGEWFRAPSSPTRFLRDLTEVRSGKPPSGPAALVEEGPRDALDDRIDQEMAKLPEDD